MFVSYQNFSRFDFGPTRRAEINFSCGALIIFEMFIETLEACLFKCYFKDKGHINFTYDKSQAFFKLF